MGVGLLLKGVWTAEDGESFAAETKSWLSDYLARERPWVNLPRGSKATEGDEEFEVEIASFDEPIVFTVIGEDEGAVTFEVSAKTSGGGPGYHMLLCELLRSYGESFGIEWTPLGDDEDGSNDETGYFFTGDANAVEDAMRRQVQTMARQSLELLEGGMTAIRWNAPLNAPTYLCPGAVLTQLGPRDKAWLVEVVRDPSRGDDIFPWWSLDEARIALGAALHAMWNEVPWREAASDDESDAFHVIASLLEQAHEGGLECPWREWAELEANLDAGQGSETSEETLEIVTAKARAVPSDVPLVGYRRYDARHVVAHGWSVQVPGSFAHEWVDDDRWAAWVPSGGTVWVSPMTLAKRDGSPVTADELVITVRAGVTPDPTLARRHEGLVGKGTFISVDPETNHGSRLNLQAFAATDGHLAVFNVYLPDPDDRAWAIETWNSLRRDGE